MTIPPQKFFLGQLVCVTEDRWPYFKEGDVGYITFARAWEVCCKGGVNPEYCIEWAYVANFGDPSCPQGVRVDKLSPVEVISEDV